MSQTPWSAPGNPDDNPGYGYGQPGYGQPGYGQPPSPGAPPGPGYPPSPQWAAARPKPGIIPLRPIGLGEIYDGAFQAIRTNPRTMVGIAAVVLAVTTAVTTVPQAFALLALSDNPLFDPTATPAQPTVDEVTSALAGPITAFLVPTLILSLAVVVMTGLLIVAVSGAVLGQKTTPGQLWARTRGRVLALVGLSLLLTVVQIGIFVVLFLPTVLLLVAGQVAAGVGLGLLALLGSVVLYAVVATRWSLAAPALLLEDLSVVASMRRSWTLVTGSFWRVLGILLLTNIVVGLLMQVLQVPFSILGTLVQVGFGGPSGYSNFLANIGQLALVGIGTVLSGAVLYPFLTAVTALLYIDLRMRREGLDVELMRASEGGIAP
jgi:hypothetical protein